MDRWINRKKERLIDRNIDPKKGWLDWFDIHELKQSRWTESRKRNIIRVKI